MMVLRWALKASFKKYNDYFFKNTFEQKTDHIKIRKQHFMYLSKRKKNLKYIISCNQAHYKTIHSTYKFDQQILLKKGQKE